MRSLNAAEELLSEACELMSSPILLLRALTSEGDRRLRVIERVCMAAVVESALRLLLAVSDRDCLVRCHDSGRSVLREFSGCRHTSTSNKTGLQPRTEANLLARGLGVCEFEKGTLGDLARSSLVGCADDCGPPVH